MRPILLNISLFLFVLGANVAFGQENAVAPKPPLTLPPPAPSPVELFRKLLGTNAAGREQLMSGKSLEARQFIEKKLREYETLSREQREVRLASLQLRWYLPQLLKLNAKERTSHLAGIPQPERTMIEERLTRWDLLPPPLQKDILENETAIRAFETPEQAIRRNANPNFERFLELSEDETKRTLARLSDTERVQIEKTFSRFRDLPANERAQALEGFRKLAELSPAERGAFLRTAEQWQKMSQKDRELWRDMVARLQAAQATGPPSLPLQPEPEPSSLIATNFN
jgi:hypothetical protein